MQRLTSILTLCLMAMMAGFVSANTLILDEHPIDVSLSPYLGLLEDPTGKLSLDKILENPDQFYENSSASPNFGFNSSAWWVRFTISNPTDKNRQMVIRQDYPLIDHLDFWASLADGQWTHIATGDHKPFDSRPLDTRDFQFLIDIAPNTSRTFVFRYQTQGSLNIGLSVVSLDKQLDYLTKEYLAVGIYYGGFIVLLAYNLLLFMSLREKVFVYYALYVLSYGTYMSVHNGLSFQYLWPNSTWLANHSLIILLALSLLWAIRFAREILSSRRLAPVADRIAKLMEVSMWVTLLVGPFMEYHTVVVPLSALTGIICFHLLVLGIVTFRKGAKPARYYLLAFSALLVGVMAYMLKTFGFLPHNAFTQNAFQIGSLLEMVLLSLAIGSRLNELKLQTTVDGLTGLHNRRHFNEQILTEFQKAQRRSQPLTLMVLDIDNFKHFNDTEGHARGDLALKAVADVLASAIRKPSISCRYGGEEFAVILPNTPATAGMTLAKRVRHLVEERTASDFCLTISIGVATMSNECFESPDELFVAADQALYCAKEQGRNRVSQHQFLHTDEVQLAKP